MRRMKGRVTDPRWEVNRRRESVEPERIVPEPTNVLPLVKHGVQVELESVPISAPHTDHRMMLPSSTIFHGVQKLDTLYSLLTEAFVV